MTESTFVTCPCGYRVRVPTEEAPSLVMPGYVGRGKLVAVRCKKCGREVRL